MIFLQFSLAKLRRVQVAAALLRLGNGDSDEPETCEKIHESDLDSQLNSLNIAKIVKGLPQIK